MKKKSDVVKPTNSDIDDVYTDYVEINLRSDIKKSKSFGIRKELNPKLMNQIMRIFDILCIVVANRISSRCGRHYLSARILSLLPSYLQKQFREELINDGRTLFNSLSMLVSWWKNSHQIISSKTLKDYSLFLKILDNVKDSIPLDYFHKRKGPRYIIFCDYVGLLLCLLRSLGLKSRLVMPIFNKFKFSDQKINEFLFYWLEVYSAFNDKWITIDCEGTSIDCKISLMQSIDTQMHRSNLIKIIAFNENRTFTDVTQNYLLNVHCTKTIHDFINNIMKDLGFALVDNISTSKQISEDFNAYELEFMSNSTFKSPYSKLILKSKIPRYEIIRPEIIIGYFKKEPFYLKRNLFKVRSRESWFTNYGRIVKENESPAKTIELKNSKKGTSRDQYLYGEWQTELFIPPPAQNGIVPKNKYGNVDLFRMEMLPDGCVYIDKTEAYKIAKELNVDFAFACTRLAFSGSRAVPNIRGIIICKEFENAILEKLSQQQSNHKSSDKNIDDPFLFFKRKRRKSKLNKKSSIEDEISTCFSNPVKGENPFE